MFNEYQPSTPSLRNKLKSSMCCFSGPVHDHEPLESEDKPRTPRSPYKWLKSTANEFPEFRYRCKSLISRISGARRHQSADYSYDPSSYALNFEDDTRYRLDELPLNFSARLPASPSHSQPKCEAETVAMRRPIVAFS